MVARPKFPSAALPDPYELFHLEVLREILSQSRQLHRMYLYSIVACGLPSVLGIAMILNQDLAQGTAATSLGAALTTFSTRFYQVSKRDSDRKLDRLLKNLPKKGI